MALPVYFSTAEDTIDKSTGLPIIKLSTGTKTTFGGTSFKNFLTADSSGGTTVASGHVGGDTSQAYSTVNAISAKMALLHNAHGNVVTPEYSLAITSSDQPFNFAGIALSDSPGGSENWEQILARAGQVIPPQRSFGQLAYFPSRQRSVLFGGIDNFILKNDTWEWDGDNWVNIVLSSPTARKAHGMIGTHISGIDQVLMYGGLNSSNAVLDETWFYFGTSWFQVTVAHSPGGRAEFGFAFDSKRHKAVLFGGYNGDTANDTWEFDGTDWSQITTVDSPNGRTNTAMAFDSFRNKTVLFSGSNGEADTWEYDGVNWTQVFVPGAVPPRTGAQMVYDAVKKKMVLFGGLDSNGNDLNDTWEYDGNAWTQIITVGPSAREYFGMAYDSGRDKIVLFGGANTTVIGGNSQTWELGSSTSAVTVQTAGDGLVFWDASSGRPTPVIGDFLGPSSVAGTVTPLYDGYTPVFGVALDAPLLLNTNLSADIDSITATITVGSTVGFPSSGTITIDDEKITYTGTTTTTFTGCTRGAVSTTAKSHIANSRIYSTVPLTLTVNNSTVGIIKMRIRPFYGFIPPLPPSITNFAPSAGEVGDTITINGSVFVGTTQVTINDTPSANASYSVISNNQITFTVPAGAQKGTITVTNPQGNSTSVAKFVTLPSITSVSPTGGSVGAGVTINGYAFTYATAVKFNGHSSAFSIVNDSQITTTIPVGGTSGDLTVEVTYATADVRIATFSNFGVVAVPHITNVAPLTGPIDGYVAITGSGFQAGSCTVNFVDVATSTQILPASITIYNDTTISAKTPNPGVPQPSKDYYIVVSTVGGTASSQSIPQQYTIIPIPKFKDASSPPTFYDTRTSTNSGVAGDQINILGDYGFTGLTSVTIAGYDSPSIHFVNDGYITAMVPSVSSTTDITGAIRVTAGGGTKSTTDTPATSPTQFTIQQAPVITSFTPLSGKTGDTVTITGSNLLAVDSVKFYNNASASFTIVNSSTITTVVPASGSGIVAAPSSGAITITKGVFTATSSSPYLFTYYPGPSISSVTPVLDAGSPAYNGGYGTSVTINGSNLNQGGTPAVKFGAVTATVGSASPGSIVVSVPTNAGNGITVTTAGGTATASFAVLAPCSISSFHTDWPYDPHAATPFYPSVIDVYGTNFRPSPYMSVTIIDPARGYESITVSFTYYDSTHIRFTAAALGDFSGGDTCYIQITTFFPGPGQYSTNVYGLYVFYPIV